jgi:di/tricarboxylate transporter
MTPEIFLVLAILVGAAALFATEKIPVDLVSILVLAVLLVLGIVTPQEGLAGFSNQATVTVAAMFVLSAALRKTGALDAVGRTLVQLGRTRQRLLLVTMVFIGAASAFINNTAAVAVFMPLVISAAAERKVSASRLLIPLSYASQFGGVCTLIGTSTNLLVSSIAEQAGLMPFGMFEFSSLGLVMCGAGVLYLLFVNAWLLPDRRAGELTETYGLREYVAELRAMPGSPLVGKTMRDVDLIGRHNVNVLEIIRGKNRIWSPEDVPIGEGDVILVQGSVKNIMEFRGANNLELEPEFKLRDAVLQSDRQKLVEVLVAPGSWLVGRTLTEANFRWRFNAIVLGIQRHGQVLREKLSRVPLQMGDALLLLSPAGEVARFHENPHLIVLGAMERLGGRRRHAPLALGIVALVVALAALKVLPIVVAALGGCAAIVLTRCLTLEQVYEAVNWKVIILLAGVLPLGRALEKSGAAGLIAGGTLRLVGDLGPVAVLAMFYLLSALLTEFMSNAAAAALIAPIAITTAFRIGCDPRPFLIAVTFAASTSFSTPVGYQTNTMVYSAGGYRFLDFIKVGVPLNLVFGVLAVFLIPKIWPF